MPRITAIEPSGTRYKLELDDGSVLRADADAVAERLWFVGCELSDGDVKLLKLHAGLRADEKAAHYLAKRPYSRRELFDKLTEAKYEPHEIWPALDKLEDAGLIDDSVYAAEAVAFASDKNLSPRAARADLLRRGLDRDLAEQALEALTPSCDAIDALLEQKLRGAPIPTDRPALSKLFSYFARRGFDSGDITSAFRRYSGRE